MKFNFANELFKSAKWNIFGDGVLNAGNIVRLGILSRFIPPEIFGISAIAFSILQFFSLVGQVGISQSIISSKKISNEIINTLIVVSIYLGLTVSLIMVVSSAYISKYFMEEQLKWLIVLMSPILLFTLIESISNAILQRRLDYKSIAIIKVYKTTITTISALILLYFNEMLYALIVPSLISSLSTALISYKFSKNKFKYIFLYKELNEALNYGISAIISNISNYICNNGVVIFLGNYLAKSDLGNFWIAQRTADISTYGISLPLHGALFPILSNAINQGEEIKKRIISFVRYQILFVIPLLVIFIFGADYLIYIAYGSGWSGAVRIYQIFMFIQIFRFTMPPSNAIIYAKGKPHISAWIVLVRVALYVAVIFYSLNMSLNFMEIIYLLAVVDIIVMFIYAYASLSVIDLGKEYIFNLYKPLAINMLLGSLLFICVNLLGSHKTLTIILIFLICPIFYTIILLKYYKYECKYIWSKIYAR